MNHPAMKPRPDRPHAAAPTPVPIQPREKLNFGLDGDLPRYWVHGDPFKSRFFDAMSTLFPVGERFFITSVRHYRERITDAHLQAEVRDFIRQEGQHTMVHTQFNNRLKEQGIDVDAILAKQEDLLFGRIAKHMPKVYCLAMTAALEHLTAMMCTTFFERRDLLQGCDPRVRAMYAWHAVEEVEHKAVAFDVYEKVAKGSYLLRALVMAQVTLGFPIQVALIMNRMLKADGFNFGQRTRLWLRGLWWFWKPGGLFPPALRYYFAYYRPGFHPWQLQEMPSYQTWATTFERTGDPIAAGNALHEAGA